MALNSVPGAKKPKPKMLFVPCTAVLSEYSLIFIAQYRPLPHPIHKEADICVFVRDPAKTYKRLIKDADLPNVKKVMGVNKLRTEWSQYEARRKLLNTYDLFICDDAISLVLTRFLGKEFITTKKFPLGVKMGPGHNIGTQILKARDSAAFYLTTGTVQSIPIGRASFSPAQVSENIQSAITGIVDHIPQKWLNVRQVSIITANSVALPIYTAVPTSPATLKEAALASKAKAKNQKNSARRAAKRVSSSVPSSASSSGAPALVAAPSKTEPKPKSSPVKPAQPPANEAEVAAPAAKTAKSPKALAEKGKKSAPSTPDTTTQKSKSSAASPTTNGAASEEVPPSDKLKKRSASSGISSPSPKKAKVSEEKPAASSKTPEKRSVQSSTHKTPPTSSDRKKSPARSRK